MKSKIYAYYEPIQTRNQKEEFARANIWKESWTKHGWDPVMLNKSHAQCSKLYQKLMTRIVQASREIKSIDQTQFRVVFAKFSRWCALHAANGGWLSEYDTINIGFTPEDAANLAAKKSLVMLGEPKSYLIYANPELCASCISKFITEGINSGENLRKETEILNFNGVNFDINQKIVHLPSEAGKSKAEAMKKRKK